MKKKKLSITIVSIYYIETNCEIICTRITPLLTTAPYFFFLIVLFYHLMMMSSDVMSMSINHVLRSSSEGVRESIGGLVIYLG